MSERREDRELARHRYRLAEDKLNKAKLFQLDGKHRECAELACYALFHAIRALFAADGVEDAREDEAVIARFHDRYIVQKVFDTELEEKVKRLFTRKCRYEADPDFTGTPEDAAMQVETVEYALTLFNIYLEGIGVQLRG